MRSRCTLALSLFALVLSFIAPAAHAAAFTPGNGVVYRVGTGSAALSAAATPAFLDEYTPAGVLVQTISLPTADSGANQILTNSGSATTEGLMTRSADGRYLVMVGYDAAVGTNPVVSTTGAAVNRIFGRVDYSGNVDTSTATTTFSAGNPRGAASLDGTQFWGSGSNTGVVYVPFGSTSVTVVSSGSPTVTNLRSINIGGTQLYVGSQAGAIRLATVGTGTPTTAGQSITNLPGFPTATALTNQYFFADLDASVAGIDTIYVADDRSTATGGGVQKWTFDGTTWTQRGTLATGLTSGLRGLTGSVSGANVTIYGTDASTTGRLVSATDTSGPAANINGTFTTLVTGGTNTAMRSVALAPVAPADAVPTVTSIVRVNSNPTNAASVDFTVTFSEGVTGVDSGDFTLTTSLGGASVTNVAGSGATYTVTVGTGSGDGTLRLDVSDNDTIVDSVSQPLGGSGSGNGNFTSGEFYTFDRTAPTVQTVTLANSNPTSASSVDFTVNFSESVSGVDAADFALTTTGVAGASVSSVSGSGTTYTVTVNTGTGDGTIRLDVLDDDSIVDVVTNPLAGTFTSGPIYDVQKSAPSVTSIVRVSANPTNAASVDFTVSFSSNVTGVDASDFVVTASGVSGANVSNVAGSGSTYTVTVTTGTGDGSLRLDVSDNDTIVNASLVPLGGAGNGNGNFTSGESFTIDKSAPTVNSVTRNGAATTNASSVTFDVAFNENVSGVDSSDFSLTTGGTISGASITGVTGSGANYSVTVNTGSGDGSIRVDVLADGSIVDGASNALAAAYSSGESYGIDKSAPTVNAVSRANTNPTSASTVDYSVAFSESVTGVDATDFAITASGVSGSSVSNVTGSGSNYTVTVTIGAGSGTIRLDVNANGTIIDAASNALAAAYTAGETYDVQRAPTAPVGLAATPGNASVTLNWTATSGATSYNVKRSTTNGGPYTVLASNVPSNVYTDNGLTNGTTYYYVVSAQNAVGESADSSQASATPAVPANGIGIVISQLFGGNGGAYTNDFIELYNPTASTVNIGGYSLQYGSATGQFGSVATNVYTFPANTTIAAGHYLSVKFGTASGTGAATVTDIDAGSTSLNMSGASGKVAFVINGTALGCGATATPCSASNPNIVDLVAYGAANNGEGGTSVKNGSALSTSEGALRKLNGCQDTNNNNNDFTVATIATNLAPRTAASPVNVCGATNNAPTINAVANPITTVAENASPFTVNVGGNDDGGIYSWSATAGTGVASVTVSAGQGTGNVTYLVTLQNNFYGTATFTATLSDNVNQAVTRTVNIAVTRDTNINHAPTITAPANPITTVPQNTASVNVNLNGNDDNAIYNWSSTLGAGVTSVSVSAGQGTSGVSYNVAIQAGYVGTASFTATLSDNVNPPVNQVVNIGVSPTGSTVSHVVISQVYGGGGNSGATYTNDFVELYNPTGNPVNLGGWTIQYSSATNTGSFSGIAPLAGIIGPAEYFLVALAGGATGAPLPPANLSGSNVNLSGTAGKVALVSNGDALSGTCGTLLTDPDIVDFVGYGTGASGANCSEGGNNAPTPSSNASSLFRLNGGDTDTNNNGNDFVNGAVNPRRTSPIQEVGPSVVSVDPINNASSAPRDANLVITFTENVDVTGSWFDITCATSGAHNSVTFAPASAARTYTIVPNVNFVAGEQCTVTLFASAIHDTDTDDSGPGTDTLSANYVWSFSIATGTAPVYPSDVHLTMGNPSNAPDDVNVPNNYLMQKPEFAISYNRDKGTPNWVSWHLADEWVGTLTRVDTFRADPAVPPTWYRVLGSDYQGSGFDRGHMTPNADRDKETSAPINQATFLMSNMIPQAPDNNQGPWANMENDLRTLLPANELYIVAGPAGVGGSGSNGGTTTTITNGHVTVPANTWKCALVLPKASGDDVARVTASTRTICVIMPNVQGIRNNDWHTYLTSVDAVEALTGYDLFSNVPDAIENAIEAGVDGTNPPGAANVSTSTREDVATTVNFDAVAPNNAALTYTVITGPAHGSLTGGGNSRTYTPSTDYNGSDSFTYRVNDGSRDSNVATVTLTVLEVNDTPTAANDSKTTAFNTPLLFPSSDLVTNDSTGPANEASQTLAVASVASTATTHGTVTLSNGTITYTPDATYSGPADFTYSVCDNGVSAGLSDPLCSSALVNVTVQSQVIAPATHFSVTAPANATTGTPFSVTVTALDASNNVVASYVGTVHFTSTLAATLPADYTFTAGDSGTHTFSVTPNAAGSNSITATDTVNASITGSASVTVNNPAPPAATHFSVTAPANATTGTPFNVTVTALDASNNVVPSYTGTVHFTSSLAATLPADYTFVAGDNGTHTFSVTPNAAGSNSITATDTVSSSITGSAAVTVNNPAPPSATHFVVTAPVSATVGTPFNVTVTALDASNNVVPSYRGTIHFTSSLAATLPADYTFVAGDNGTHTFSVTPNAAGSNNITATDTTTASITGSASVTVNNPPPPPATHFVVTAPASATVGTPFTVTVTALDASNNVVPSYTGTVHFTSSLAATLPADYTFVSGDNGSHTFSVTPGAAGSNSITVTDTTTPSISGNATVTVNNPPAATATHFLVTGPTSATVGSAFTITVTALDANDAIVPNYSGAVHFTSTLGATLPENYTFTSSDNGVHSFSVRPLAQGTNTISVQDGNGVSGSIVVNVDKRPARPAERLLLMPSVSSIRVNEKLLVTVAVVDSNGRVVTDYFGTIHFTSSLSAELPADYTFNWSDQGTHTFEIKPTKDGQNTLSAFDTTNSSIGGSATINVTKGPRTRPVKR